MKKLTLNPVLLSRLLMASLAVGIILIGVGFYFAQQQLSARALTTNHTKIESELIQDETQRLSQLQDYLKENTDQINRAADVVAESQQYQYQNEVIEDLNSYAAQTGIKILSFDFPVSDAKTAAPGPGGLKKTAIVVNIAGPLPYDNLMKFVRSIEQNLTKLQISTLTLTPDEKDTKLIASSSVGLEVFLR